MAIDVLCPICGASYSLPDAQRGKRVRCKKCEHPFTAQGDQKPRETGADDDDGFQDAPRGKPKATAPDRRGRDRDDDRPRKTRPAEAQARRRSAREPGVPVGAVLILGVVGVVLILCGGGAALLYHLWPADDGPAAAAQANGPVGPPPARNDFAANDPFNRRQPGGGAADVANLDEALKAVRDNDPARREAGADWLSRAPRDEGRAAEVAKALDVLVRNARPDVFGHEPARQAALQALREWGTAENVPTLVEFLQTARGNQGSAVHMPDQLRDAMTALARIGDERGTDGLLPWLGDFFVGEAAEAALRRMGPKAEKGLLKHYDDPDDDGLPGGIRIPGGMRPPGGFRVPAGPGAGKREAVRRLLRDIGTKPEVILDQVVTDLKGVDSERRLVAAESLEKLPVVEARRDEVSRALNTVLDDPDADTSAAGVPAAKAWGTKHNVPALVRHVSDNGPFATPLRVAAMEALAAIKDERGVWPVARWLGDVFNGEDARRTIEKLGPVAEKAGLEHLKDPDGTERLRAWLVLSVVGTPGNVATMEEAAKKETDRAVRTNAEAALRLVKQRR
jgi:predicted Zn finger-like uncharacterized protein